MEVSIMSHLLMKLQAITLALSILPEQMIIIADDFHQAMVDGLVKKASSLKMLPSYLNKPSGREHGAFLALDFGGTNLRVLLAELLGAGGVKIQEQVSRPLKDKQGHYNYISDQSTAEELFDFIATQIGTIIQSDTTYPLGHTFSFPINQTSLNTGTLIHWTKEIETQGVEGAEITALLTAALERKKMSNILPQAIINDTVGTLLTGAYTDSSTDIGSICGTGHNTAYLDPCAPWTKQPMIINLESGNFDKLPLTSFDRLLDDQSEKPGSQRLEKMVSGHYIGELVRIIACSLFEDGFLSNATNKEILTTPYLLSGAHLSLLLEDTSAEFTSIAGMLEDTFNIVGSTIEDRQALKTIASVVSIRSARLVAATYVGILQHVDPHLAQDHNIAIDGSLYEKIPGYAKQVQTALLEALGTTGKTVTTTLTKDGSGIGAAIATAIVTQ